MAETARVIPRRHARRDMRWLEVRGRTFYAVQAVPRPLRARARKRRLVKSLGTRDYHVAVARRHAALAQFQRTLDWRGVLPVPTLSSRPGYSGGRPSRPLSMANIPVLGIVGGKGDHLIRANFGQWRVSCWLTRPRISKASADARPPLPLWGSRWARLRRCCYTLTLGCARAVPRGPWRLARGRNIARTCRVLPNGREQLASPPWKPSPTSWPAGM